MQNECNFLGGGEGGEANKEIHDRVDQWVASVLLV